MPDLETQKTVRIVHDGSIIKENIMEHVTTFSLHEIEQLDTIGRYPLKKPILFKSAYDASEKVWSLWNDKLALYGVGETYEEMICSLEEEIESHAICFTKLPDNKRSEDALHLKRNLEEYINFNMILKICEQKYGA